jgi:plastocyanin
VRALRAPAAAGAVLFLLLLPSAAAAPAELQARDDALYNPRFEPSQLTVAPGETVRVRNTGSDRHTVTSVDGLWPEVDLAAGREGSFRAPPGEAGGSFRFYCRYHASPEAQPGQGMAGVLRVVPILDPGPTPAPTPGPSPPASRTPLDLGVPLLAAAGAALLLQRRS